MNYYALKQYFLKPKSATVKYMKQSGKAVFFIPGGRLSGAGWTSGARQRTLDAGVQADPGKIRETSSGKGVGSVIQIVLEEIEYQSNCLGIKNLS